jgi:anthranilate phosphoribosyltransferase
MLKQKTISQLLSGELKEADVKKTLLELTPEKLDPASFKRCIEEVRQFCSPDFAKLSGLGANAIDCSGTGGSGRPRFNTSTASAFILSAASIKVAKFGNRAATSTSGSFDLLGQLNIAEKITPTAAARILDAASVVFIFAPAAYPALAAIAPIRAALGASTVFNFIGPLLNPVCPAYRVMGVANPIMQHLATTFIKELASNACSIIVRSKCGLDEICPRCGTDVREVRNGKVVERTLDPTYKDGDCKAPTEKYGPERNAEIFLRIASGEDANSYEYELICQNAGAGLYACAQVYSIEEGAALAKEILASGDVEKQFQKVKEAYAKYAP